MNTPSTTSGAKALDKRRHVGQLHQDSSTGATTDFTNPQLQAGRTFQADLDTLLAAVKQWEGCLDDFLKAASPLTRPATIPDGSGPVAHHLGTRFNHRLGVQGGVGYAAETYVKQFVAILEGLSQSAQNYTAVEERNAGTITGQAGQSGVAQQ